MSRVVCARDVILLTLIHQPTSIMAELDKELSANGLSVKSLPADVQEVQLEKIKAALVSATGRASSITNASSIEVTLLLLFI